VHQQLPPVRIDPALECPLVPFDRRIHQSFDRRARPRTRLTAARPTNGRHSATNPVPSRRHN
jgi:hypothetical protein